MAGVRSIDVRTTVTLLTALAAGLCLALLHTYPIRAAQNENAPVPIPITLKIAQAEWCPQMCNSGEQAGYVNDILNEVFAESDYTLSYHTYPWSRAIALVKRGQMDALLAPTQRETPDFIFPSEAVGYQRMCFYVSPDYQWEYTGPQSLKGLRIGITPNVSYAKLDRYLRENRHQFQSIADSNRHVEMKLRMIKSKRLDTFIETDISLAYYMKKLALNYDIKQVGCLPAAPIYIAFSPDTASGAKLQKAREYFERGMRELKSDGRLTKIMAAYGLPG